MLRRRCTQGREKMRMWPVTSDGTHLVIPVFSFSSLFCCLFVSKINSYDSGGCLEWRRVSFKSTTKLLLVIEWIFLAIYKYRGFRVSALGYHIWHGFRPVVLNLSLTATLFSILGSQPRTPFSNIGRAGWLQTSETFLQTPCWNPWFRLLALNTMLTALLCYSDMRCIKN